MKMKEFSALTGISDRTIRYYIDDGLFIPENYTENYEGRRSYEFTENDVKRLKQIALLRKYGFSISEIKELEKGNSDLKDIIDTRASETKQNSENQLEEIKTLQAVSRRQPQSFDELCEMLSNPVIEQAPIPNIDEQSAYKPMYDKPKKKTALFCAAFFSGVTIFTLIGCVYSTFLSVSSIDKYVLFFTIKAPLILIMVLCSLIFWCFYIKDAKKQKFEKYQHITFSIIIAVLSLLYLVIPSSIIAFTTQSAISSTCSEYLSELYFDEILGKGSMLYTESNPVSASGYKIFSLTKYEGLYEKDMDIRKYINPIDDGEKYQSVRHKVLYLNNAPNFMFKLLKEQFRSEFYNQVYLNTYFTENEVTEYTEGNVNYCLFFRDGEYKDLIVLSDNGRDLLLFELYLQDDYKSFDYSKDDILSRIERIMQK